MCDKATRLWCCRISLIFSVLGVLITMIYQIWTYYFYLVKQMDDITLETPELHAIIRHCNNESTLWHATCDTQWTCTIPPTEGADTFVDATAGYMVNLVGQTLKVTSVSTLEECFRVMVWKLPWEF